MSLDKELGKQNRERQLNTQADKRTRFSLGKTGSVPSTLFKNGSLVMMSHHSTSISAKDLTGLFFIQLKRNPDNYYES